MTPTPLPTPNVTPIPAASPWVTTTNMPDTPPNAAFVNDPPWRSDKRLDSPVLSITSANSTLSFRNKYDMEASGGIFWDGGVLEISSPNINGGAFTDVTDPAVGGSFVSGGYNGVIYNQQPPAHNPLTGRMAWSGSTAGVYITTVVNLGPNVNGQNIRIRFRFGSDEAEPAGGWWIDTITLTTGGTCPSPSPTPPPTTPTPPATPTPPMTPVPTPTPMILRFCNTASIDMTLNSAAVPYPSNITVSGAPSQTGGVRVTLNNLYHVFPDNVDVLLVGPQGQKFVLMGDSGGPTAIPDTSPVTLTFQDFVPNVLPNNGPLTSGVFEPTTWRLLC